ncbi:MAG: dipeptidase, partial [Parasphingopyxis sp.]
TLAGLPGGLVAHPGPHRRDRIVIDSLGGFSDPNFEGEDESDDPRRLSDRILDDAAASGVTAVLVTLDYVAGPADPFEATVRDLGLWDARIRNSRGRLVKIRTAADILRAKADGKIGVIYGFQNAAMVGDDATWVDSFGDFGVRCIQLTYNPENRLGGGSLVPDSTGLTDFGRQVIDRLNARDIMTDLSHSNRQTCLDAAAYSDRPISVNHTGCRALADLPRNKSDEELRAVAEKGGYVGIYFMPFLDLGAEADTADVVRHIDHAVRVCGEDHVGIGSDGTTTGLDDLAAYRRAVRTQNEERHRLGIAAEGERLDMIPIVPELIGPDKFRRLADALSAHGFSEARIDKILGLNFLRFAREVWGG